MAVNQDDIDLIAARHVAAYREAELQILGIVRDALDSGMDAPTWTETRLDAVVALRRAAEAVMSRLSIGDPAIRADVARAYRNGRGGAALDLVGALGAEARAARRNVPQVAAMDSLATALIRDIGEKRRNVLRHVDDVYRQTQAAAVARMLAGGITRREASQAAWQGFVDQGVTSFTDKAGRVWRLSTYVEMAVRTVSQRAAVQGQVDQLVDMGVGLVYVSDDLGECERCRPWERKILRISGDHGRRTAIAESVTELADTGQQVMTAVPATREAQGTLARIDVAGSLAEAMLAGLFHPNCGHSVSAYLPGATRIPDGPTADPEGNKAKARQREIERAIRHHKERAEAALTPEAKRAANVKVRAWQATMREHLAANPNLKRLSYREEIGAGNIPPGGGRAPSPAGLLPGPPAPDSGGGGVKPAKPPATPPAPAPPDRAAKRAAARARQAEIEQRAPIGELLAEIDELLHKGADRATYLQRLNLAATTGVDKAAVESLRRALGNEEKLRNAIGRIERKHGLSAIGRAGEHVAFDPGVHEALGDAPADGATVEIVRRGTVLDLNGERIQLERARVSSVVVASTAPDPFTIPDGVPDLADLIASGASLRASDPVKYVNGAPLDPAPWQLLMSGELGDAGKSVTVRVDTAVYVMSPGSRRGPSVQVRATVLRRGKNVGKVTRSYRQESDGTLIATHNFLELDKAVQGSGFSAQFNGRLIAWYRRSGVDRVEVHANIDVGGYAWASAGYDFEDAKEVRRWIFSARLRISDWADPSNDELRKYFPKLTAAERLEQVRLLEDLLDVAESVRPVSAYEFSQLGRKPGQGGKKSMWIGKAIMLNSDWHGVLRLAPNP